PPSPRTRVRNSSVSPAGRGTGSRSLGSNDWLEIGRESNDLSRYPVDAVNVDLDAPAVGRASDPSRDARRSLGLPNMGLRARPGEVFRTQQRSVDPGSHDRADRLGRGNVEDRARLETVDELGVQSFGDQPAEPFGAQARE